MDTSDILRPVRIQRVVQEASNIRTFIFEDSLSANALPGQFLMVWLPGTGEFPMSVALPYSKNSASITVKAMGAGSKALYESASGDLLGIRGPYGVPFQTKNARRILLVGGGTGMAPIIYLAKQISSKKGKIVIAAKSKNELAFLKQATRHLGRRNVFPATDDGSLGFHGYAHEKVAELLKEEKFDLICACGPEAMMYAVKEVAQNIPVQFSLERIMKCGIGVCGSCSIGEIVLCKDGPVLNSRALNSVRKEFGHLHRDKAGRLRPLNVH